MSATFPSASPVETALFNLVQVVPNGASGQFAKRARVMGLITRLNTDRLVVALLSRMQDKYQSPAVWIRMLGEKSLLLFGVEALQEVLDHSGWVYASDPKLKKMGMGHFMPGAVTISRGEEWQERRRFNEAVLATHERVHPLAASFLAIVRSEVARMLADLHGRGHRLQWHHVEELFEKLALQIIFGDSAREDHATAAHLHQMMSEANRIVGLGKSEHFEPFYQAVRKYIAAGEPGSLVCQIKDVESSAETCVERQPAHWLFAMKDTLAANTYRALAAIVAHPGAEQRIRQEVAQADLDDPAGIDALRYLEGCLEETMRLWPTTNLYQRETMRETTLAGIKVPEGTQLIIDNTFNHRNRKTTPDADAFRPERWLEQGRPDYRFNHLSNGSQFCAATWLLLFLGKAVLASLLVGTRFILEQPSAEMPVSVEQPEAGMATRLSSGLLRVPELLFAGGRGTLGQLGRLARQPDQAASQLRELLGAVPAAVGGAQHDAGEQSSLEPGKPMPYMLNFFTLRFHVEPA
jgi:cytochrome P450